MGGVEYDIAFGRFRLDADRRSLLADGAPIALSSRAFDILRLLIEKRQQIVTKDEIMERVWRGMIVDENNLAVQVSALRRALCDRDGHPQLIMTIPGRGYRFVGEIIETPPTIERPSAEMPPTPPSTANPQVRQWRGRSTVGVLMVLIGLVAALAAGYLALGHGRLSLLLARPQSSPRLSMVVLPFRNLSDDPQDGYLADAVSDDLTTDLSHLPGSVVIARTSADTYKGRLIGAEQIGRELGVRYLLEGSLRRAGDRVLINAQLIDTESGSHLWAERFDAPRQELADTQTAIVRHIASALDFTLVQIESRRSLHDRPNNPDALDLFFRARSLIDRDQTLKGFVAAQALLEQAIRLQPDFADAMSELAWLLLKKTRDFDDPTDPEDMAAARKLIARAIELVPQNARVLAAKGFLLKLDGRCRDAIASYELALSFDRNDVDARTGLALCAANLGQPEKADTLLRDLLLIDPQDPKNRVRFGQLGLVDLMLGRNEEAIDWFHRAAAGDPDPVPGDESLSRGEYNEMGLIAGYSLTGRDQEARAHYATYRRLWPHRTVWRLASYFTKAEAALPGLQAAMASLKAAGMPEFADDTLDDRVAAVETPRISGDFEPTPKSVPGARTIDTAGLSRLIRNLPAPVVVDVGCGAAVVPGAVWLYQTFPSVDAQARLKSEIEEATHGARDRTVVVMGSGPYGWNGYNAALALVALGYRDVVWYRGGEEAWTAAGLKPEDRRDP